MRLSLRAGQTRTATFRIPVASLAYWNAAAHAWTVEREAVAFDVGGSSADVRLTASVQLR